MHRYDKNYIFNAGIAQDYGINCAVMLQYFAFWYNGNKANDINAHQSTWWFYHKMEAFQEQFPYMTLKSIRDTIGKLYTNGLIKKGEFNANPYDHTTWYTLTPKSLELLELANCPKGQIDVTERANRCDQKGKSTSKKVKERYSPAIQDIISYLNEKTGSSYRANTEKTRTLIKARLDEGFTVDDFKKVINIKCEAWLQDSKMKVYLRPITLFGTKFESYLNEKQVRERGELPLLR